MIVRRRPSNSLIGISLIAIALMQTMAPAAPDDVSSTPAGGAPAAQTPAPAAATLPPDPPAATPTTAAPTTAPAATPIITKVEPAPNAAATTAAPTTAAPTTPAPTTPPPATPAATTAALPVQTVPGAAKEAPVNSAETAKANDKPGATPKAAVPSPLVDIALNDGRIETAVAMINAQLPNGNVLTVFGKVSGARVTVVAEKQPIESVLNLIANPNNWVWKHLDSGDYGLYDREYYERNVLPGEVIQKVFRPNNIKASELDRAIKALITPNVGSSVADDRTNKLIVNDLPPALERIERFIREIDVQLIVRVFYIRQAVVPDIAKKLEQYKSGPGTIETDEKTHQIIVTDLLSNIKKMELLVDILDVGPEIVQYDINNIGIDGEDLEGLQKIIDSIRTKDLLFEVNDKQGVMILEDVPEVHEKVEKILAEFDKPVRQVLIQGEIVSTGFDREFAAGVQRFDVAHDLLTARSVGALGATTDSSAGGVVPSNPAAVAPVFANLDQIFPNFELTGKTISASYLSSSVGLQLQAAYSDVSTRVLLQPRLLIKNQQESHILVGADVPYVTTFFDDGQNGTSNTSGRTTTTQSTVSEGLDVTITPSISNSKFVELELKLENNKAKISTESGTRLVGRDRQVVDTTLQIPSGQTRMIGGLISNSNNDSSSGLPFLSSLPYIGALFGQKQNGRVASNLMIFLTPTVIAEEVEEQNKRKTRGRSLTNYERVPGDLEDLTKAPMKAGEHRDETPATPENKLLSDDNSDEKESIDRLQQAKRARNTSEADAASGNYQPGASTGSATLNSGAPGVPFSSPPVQTYTPPRTIVSQPSGNPGNDGNSGSGNAPANPPGNAAETRYK